MSHVDLSALFRGMQGQMQSQLNTNREFIYHPGSKGDALEMLGLNGYKIICQIVIA